MKMEELLSSVEKSCCITTDRSIRNQRIVQYKSYGPSVDLGRENRRLYLLESYKRKRDALVDEKRGLLSDDFIEKDEWMDWQENKRSQKKNWMNPHCKNQLMLSEWLLDRPSDLDTNWITVVCPEGRRTLVIAKKGCTRAYHKSGFLLAKFKSVLPNGAPSNTITSSDLIILDCIWNASTKCLFALDVLHWKNQTLLNCDAEFRLYWLQTKLSEVKQGLLEECLQPDIYDVYLPSHCHLSTLTSTLENHDPKKVDGILFYHKRAPYISGTTPLVGWLKPFMLPERLGVTTSLAYLESRPPEYTTLEDWVLKVSHKHCRNPSKTSHKQMKSTQESITSQEVITEMEESIE